MIRIFPFSNLNHTVFREAPSLSYLASHSVEITNDASTADFFLARKMDTTLFNLIANWCTTYKLRCKPLLIWTHEPRFCPTDQPVLTEVFPEKVHIMNLYTHDVYFSNFTFYGKAIDQQLQYVHDVSFTQRPVAALASFIDADNRSLFIHNRDIDLSARRQRLMLDGHEQKIVDIYGKGWSDAIKVAESRGAGWQDSKIAILKKYQFNICLENASYRYYCTEKIWDSIKGYCLPIYSGLGNNIYELFPKDSFIDIDAFDSDHDLWAFIQNMQKEEYLTRLNTCIRIFNQLQAEINPQQEKEKALSAISAKLHSLMR